MADKRKIAAVTGDGRIIVIEQDIPPVRAGTVLVEVHSSLISPGTELKGWRAFSEKRNHPDSDGGDPRPFGYSNAGVVLAVGEGVAELTPGDRVGCLGGGYAQHADYAVVPHNLCTKLPDNVTFAQGAYGNLGCTAINAVRRAAPELGEFVAVAGLGIVGNLSGQLFRTAGCFVIGWDMIPFRTELAEKTGFDCVVQVGQADEVEATKEFTDGFGLDAAVLAFGGDGTDAFLNLRACLKQSVDGHAMGRIVQVGGANVQHKWKTANLDWRMAARTGPGYHDEEWETGRDYPPVFIRWTTRSNFRLLVRLVSEGKLDLDATITHRIPLDDVEAGIAAILDDPDRIMGVVLEMKHE